jgi:D,D-heptose 1,7-bisphosphate phosphatase
MQVIFQAGGKGSRLYPLTKNKPKCFLKINNKTIFHYQYECLKKYDLHKNILIISNKNHVNFFNNFFLKKKIKAKILIEKPGLGNAGSLKKNYKFLEKNFIYIFNDIFFNINFDNFIKFKKNNIKILCHKTNHSKDSDTIIFDQNNRINKIFLKKNNSKPKSNTSMSGIFFLKKKIFYRQNKMTDLTQLFLNKLKNNKIFCYYSNEFFQDFGTLERFKKLKKNFSNKKKKIAIIFDRDGTIIKDKSIIKNLKKDIIFFKEFIFFIKKIKKFNPILICITNQAAIAKGFISFHRLSKIHNFINKQLYKITKSSFDDFYFCPHYPKSGYTGEIKKLKKICSCRKPKAGLFQKAKKKYNLNQTKLYNIGNNISDIKAGIIAGIKKNYLVNKKIIKKKKRNKLHYTKNFKIYNYRKIYSDII